MMAGSVGVGLEAGAAVFVSAAHAAEIDSANTAAMAMELTWSLIGLIVWASVDDYHSEPQTPASPKVNTIDPADRASPHAFVLLGPSARVGLWHRHCCHSRGNLINL